MRDFENAYVWIEFVKDHLFVIHFKAVEPSIEMFEEYLREMERFYKSNNGIIFVFDATNTKYLPSEFRIMQGEWLIENEKLLKEKCIGHVYVLSNMLISLILKGVFLIKKTPVPYRVVKTVANAMNEADQMLSAFLAEK